MKLKKKQLQERDELVSKLRAAAEALEGGIDAFNNAMEAAWAQHVEKVAEEYRAAVEEANSFVEGVASDIENFFDEKSERWQEGDGGEAVGSMLSDWQGFDGEWDPEDLDKPDPLDEPELKHADDLEALPEGPG